MNIDTQKAADLFFPAPSLESVYFEAIANSFDANAEKIDIDINIGNFNDVETFDLDIIDNGDGFTDESFERFRNLLKAKGSTNKGIGRLVFLKYFDFIAITSIYDHSIRDIHFSWDFDGTSKVQKQDSKMKKTHIKFRSYNKSKIKEYAYVTPSEIKEDIIQNFLPRLYRYKKENRKFEINVSLETNTPNPDYGFYSTKISINNQSIPDLIEEPIEDGIIDLVSKFNLYYSIKKTFEPTSVITAICVDERTIPVPLFTKKSMPDGYELIFLMFSDFFIGKSNTTRDTLDIDDDSIRRIRNVFIKRASALINELIPGIKERNKKINEDLESKYPHLQGYFENETIGLIEKEKTLEIAQKGFMKDQKEILEADSIEDVQYEKSLNVSSRILAEYILYRSIIIDKLKAIDYKEDEAKIHNIIVPKNKIFRQSEFIESIFFNNAWLLDDKYMSYSTILSDKKIKHIYNVLQIEDKEEIKEDDRPDITIIFSDDPDKATKTDVVIVELKKLGLGLARREELVSQLKQRARVLLKYYPDKIQRIWFYGIVDIDPEFRISLLEEEYIELFSTGSMFYKEHSVIIDEAMPKIPIGLFIQSFESFLKDAEARNLTFLTLLKEGIKAEIQ